MTKNKLISKKSMVDYFKNIKELENRKITYDKAISEVEQEIENAKVYNSKPEPTFFCVDYDNYNDSHSGHFFLFLILFTPILILILILILFLIWKCFNITADFPFPIAIILGIIIGAIIAIKLQTFLYNRMYCKKENEYHNVCQQIREYNNQQKEEANRRSEMLRFEKNTDLNEWRLLNTKIEKRLEYLYNMQIIPQKYQNAVAISFFVSYLESGRCDTLKECMNKYDDDVMYYQLKGRLEAVYQRIGEMEGRLSRELKYLKNSFESDLQDMQILINNNSSQIERISYNQKTNELLSSTLIIGNL